MTDAIVRDSNGIELNEGDSVTLIKDLKVKGTSENRVPEKGVTARGDGCLRPLAAPAWRLPLVPRRTDATPGAGAGLLKAIETQLYQ